jgi:hypothetical protein
MRAKEGGHKMKKLLESILLVLAIVVPIPAIAEVNISIGFPLPPPIIFPAPPEVIVMPDTNYVYIVPDIEVDVFFWGGWWWRPWEGRWYRSHYYDRGWAYYNNVPSFYFDVDPGWRGYYRNHNWYGHPWNYERIPNQRLQQNWKSWRENRYWERHGTWGVQGYQPRPRHQKQELRHQRQQQYQQRPEVQRHRQQMQQQQRQSEVKRPQGQQQKQQQQRQPEIQRPEGQRQPQQKHPQPEGRPNQGESRNKQSQERPERENAEHGR